MPEAPAIRATASDRWLGDRDVSIDVARGVAILALILVNFPAAGPADAFLPPTELDRTANLLVRIFLGRKFYTLFAVLFGFSFVLFARSRTLGDTSLGRLWTRRMVVLLAIGYIHAIFVWHGDILGDYARAGLLLIFVRRWTTRSLVAAAMVTLSLTLVSRQVWYKPTAPVNAAIATAIGMGSPSAHGATAPPSARQPAARRPLRDGSYVDVVKMRAGRQLQQFKREPLEEIVRFYALEYFGFFLIGVAAARRLLPDPQQHRPLLWRAAAVGLLVGLPIVVALSYRPVGSTEQWGPAWANHLLVADGPTAGEVAELPARTLLALAYGALIVLACGHAGKLRRVRPLVAVGRMGLSNYLAQSVFFTTLVYGYGFGGWGAFSRTDTLLISAMFFILQMIGSTMWLGYFRHGPVEWVWRSLTYWRVQPLRR